MNDCPNGALMRSVSVASLRRDKRLANAVIEALLALHPQWTCFPPISGDLVGSSATWLDD